MIILTFASGTVNKKRRQKRQRTKAKQMLITQLHRHTSNHS